MIPSLKLALVAALLPLAASAAAQGTPPEGQEVHPPEFYQDPDSNPPRAMPTKVISPADLIRLINNTGMSLQWMSGQPRGQVRVLVGLDDGEWRIIGTHGGPGDSYVGVDGVISEVGDDYFILNGDVTIRNTPDPGRVCSASGQWRFAITQNRKYYRLRHFEWCDGLTDYIDIHF